jgi:outer membrane receptor protein involved in Fe transport
VLNAGTAEAKGLETEFTYLISENWSISGTYAYIDSEITELVENGAKVSSDRLPIPNFIPENEASLSLNYDQEFSSFKVAATAMYRWVDWMYGNDESAQNGVDETAGLPDGLELSLEQAKEWVESHKTDPHGILNLNVTLSPLDDQYNVTFWVKNALDERKTNSSIAFISGNAYQYSTHGYTEPRMWGVTVQANF